MLRVTLRGAGLDPVVLGSDESLVVGRAPDQAIEDRGSDDQLRVTPVTLPHCSPHVSRLLGELLVGEEIVRLRWHGKGEAQLSSLFDAPGGARRVTLTSGMTAMLDEGENQVLVLRGREIDDGSYRDLLLVVEVAEVAPEAQDGQAPRVTTPPPTAADADASATAPAPQLERESREWFVALALAEPWLAGADDYPRPPSNREIYERVLRWHGYAWNLQRPQRVDEGIRVVSRLAFGPNDDPFDAPTTGRAQNVRFAVGRRAAEVRLVTSDDLQQMERRASERATDQRE